MAIATENTTQKRCDRIAWLDPIPTGRSGEYISVMTRRITPVE